MALLLRTWTFSRFSPPTVAMWIEGENEKEEKMREWKEGRNFHVQVKPGKFNKITLTNVREREIARATAATPHSKYCRCCCMCCGNNAGYFHSQCSLIFHGHDTWKLFAVKKYFFAQLPPTPSPHFSRPTFVLNFVIFTSHSLIMDTAAATYSNTHHHFAIQCTFSFCEFSHPPQSSSSSSSLFLNPESVSLSLIHPTIATSGGRQLKYLKLKAPKKRRILMKLTVHSTPLFRASMSVYLNLQITPFSVVWWVRFVASTISDGWMNENGNFIYLYGKEKKVRRKEKDNNNCAPHKTTLMCTLIFPSTCKFLAQLLVKVVKKGKWRRRKIMAKREGVYDAHSSDIQLTKANICNCVRFSNNMKIKQGDYETHRGRGKERE